MDINYILGCEQTSLHNAQIAASPSARASHRGLAVAYGRLLAGSIFPHRDPLQLTVRGIDENSADRWDDDGGTVQFVTEPVARERLTQAADISLSELIEAVERNERLLAVQFSAGKVSASSFQSRSTFLRQDRARLAARTIEPAGKVS